MVDDSKFQLLFFLGLFSEWKTVTGRKTLEAKSTSICCVCVSVCNGKAKKAIITCIRYKNIIIYEHEIYFKDLLKFL